MARKTRPTKTSASSTKKKGPAKKTPARRKPATKRTARTKSTSPVEEQLRAVRAIGAALATAVGLDALLARIVPHVSELMGAERTTLFLYEPNCDEIWSKVAQGEDRHEIRLPVGHGLAGWVAEHRERLLVNDAYQDSRFNPNVDARTGFRTRSVAAAPLVNRQGELQGVLQVLNKKTGPFTSDDLDLLDAIAVQTSYAVENARLSQQILDQNRELEAEHQRAERRRAELDLLYQLEKETAASADLDDLLDSVIVRVAERMRSEAGSVLLTDRDTGRLYFRGVSGNAKDELKQVTLEPGEGVVGWVAQTGEGVVVNHPEEDPRHDRSLAERLNVPAIALLAVPLIWNNAVIGAMEVLNPRPRPTGAIGYDLEDLKVLTLSAGQVARAVALTLERQARIDTERLAVIGRMLAGVAHDLRNPMTAISGYAQLMAIDADQGTRQRRCDRVLIQIDEMTAMISDLLAFARGDTALNPVATSAEKLASDIEEALLLYTEPRQIGLEVTATGDTALVDVGRTKRIVYNLAKNAVDVLRAGGTLRVQIDEQGGGLAVRVIDDGPGLPAEIRSRIFQPFVTSGKVNGTGLGLSIVKRFVDDHGGQIEVESKLQRGTTFVVRLPKIQPVEDQGEP